MENSNEYNLHRIKKIQNNLNEVQSKKDKIVEKASRMVKDHDASDVRGMTEVPTRFIKELDQLLYELDQLESIKI